MIPSDPAEALGLAIGIAVVLVYVFIIEVITSRRKVK